jgi:hypothetical protein
MVWLFEEKLHRKHKVVTNKWRQLRRILAYLPLDMAKDEFYLNQPKYETGLNYQNIRIKKLKLLQDLLLNLVF